MISLHLFVKQVEVCVCVCVCVCVACVLVFCLQKVFSRRGQWAGDQRAGAQITWLSQAWAHCAGDFREKALNLELEGLCSRPDFYHGVDILWPQFPHF